MFNLETCDKDSFAHFTKLSMSQSISVTRFWNKKYYNFSLKLPKISHRAILTEKVMLFKIALKIAKYLGQICTKNRHKAPSKEPNLVTLQSNVAFSTVEINPATTGFRSSGSSGLKVGGGVLNSYRCTPLIGPQKKFQKRANSGLFFVYFRLFHMTQF